MGIVLLGVIKQAEAVFLGLYASTLGYNLLRPLRKGNKKQLGLGKDRAFG